MKMYLSELKDDAKSIFASVDKYVVSDRNVRNAPPMSCAFDDWALEYDKAWATTRLTECEKDDHVDISSGSSGSRFRSPCPPLDDLNPEQRNIILYVREQMKANKQILILIHGAPGTGKTTYVAKSIIRECVRPHMRAELLAYTGVAAMAGEGYTIQKYLGISPARNDIFFFFFFRIEPFRLSRYH